MTYPVNFTLFPMFHPLNMFFLDVLTIFSLHQSHANRYKRYILHVLSVFIDFWVCVYVQLFSESLLYLHSVLPFCANTTRSAKYYILVSSPNCSIWLQQVWLPVVRWTTIQGQDLYELKHIRNKQTILPLGKAWLIIWFCLVVVDF